MRTICPVNVPWLPNFFDIVAPMSGWVSVEGCVVRVCMGVSLGWVVWLVGIVVATSVIELPSELPGIGSSWWCSMFVLTGLLYVAVVSVALMAYVGCSCSLSSFVIFRL